MARIACESCDLSCPLQSLALVFTKTPMLRTLYLRDFVIVEQLAIEFSSGFTVFSGETGAGKSILIDALNLVLGERGGPESIREGAAKTEISSQWDNDSEMIQAWLAGQEIEVQDELILRRTIDQTGRSRGFINGTVVTLSQLRELGSLLIDIHGQHAHQSLLQTDQQRILLDRHGHLETQALTVTHAYQAWHHAAQLLNNYQMEFATINAERERLVWQVSELEKLSPKAGEWDEVQQAHSRLSHASNLIEVAQTGVDLLRDSEAAMNAQLAHYSQRLSREAQIDQRLSPIAQMLESAQIQLNEAAHDLTVYLEKIDLDPTQMQQIDFRVEALHSASRKFRCAPEALPQLLLDSQTKLDQLAHPMDEADLTQEVARLKADYDQHASALSLARKTLAMDLAHKVTDSMQTLNMQGGAFEVALLPIAASAQGNERIEFRVAGHAGVAPKSLARVASGGELARIALAITVIAAQATATPTLVFDEVDSGIGGAVAEVVGRLLQQLGQSRQVLCVTHLPQVASLAKQHFLVRKEQVKGAPKTEIYALQNETRVQEIARMLGGVEITATTRQHAEEWLQRGRT